MKDKVCGLFQSIYTTTKVSKYLSNKEETAHELKLKTDYKDTDKRIR